MATDLAVARADRTDTTGAGPPPALVRRPIGLKITVIARLIRKQFDHSTSSIGITRAQWTTIAAVAGVPGTTQRGIAAILEVGEVTAGRLIDKLCEEGLLERQANPNDRRSHLIYLKPAAYAVLEKLTSLGALQEKRAFAGLSEQELATLDALLERINDNLNKAERDIPATSPSMPGIDGELSEISAAR